MLTALDAGLAPDLVGYLGAAAIATAYLLNQNGALRSDDWRFPGINLLGSGFILLSLYFHMNWPSLLIEVFWSAISVYGLARSRRTRG